jgi:hypothetical protein
MLSGTTSQKFEDVRASALTRPVYVAAIGLSAFLLFSVQPLFAKLVLPRLGGSPAVWSVTSVVFQCLLLAGYAYAHAIASLRTRTTILIHLAVLAAASLALPIGLAPGWQQAPAGYEAIWLAAFVLVSVGLPFFAVSANGPLLQALFARTAHRDAADPYFLYAASNIGSFGALAAYPFLLEPTLRLRGQADSWAVGFAVLTVLIGAASVLALHGRAKPAAKVEEAPRPASRKLLIGWMALAAVPSGLLVAVTAHVTTDIAPMPLLWALPLGLYLLSFVVAFRPNGWLDAPYLTLLRVGLTFAAILTLGKVSSLGIALALHLGMFMLTAIVCHGMLFRLRPPPSGLTGFYLALSAGGAVGGLFCGLAAPFLFDTLAEYPIGLAAALACRPDIVSQSPRLLREALRAVAICAAIALVGFAAKALGAPSGAVFHIVTAAIAGFAILRWRSAATTLVAVATLAAIVSAPTLRGNTETRNIRSFFGIHTIDETTDGRFRYLMHGTTVHGAARLREDDGTPVEGRPEPTTYYGPERVLGTAIASIREAAGGRIGTASLVGLGTGSLACHRQDGEEWSYYEIDAAVVRIARDESLFPFLKACGQAMPIVLGDARLTLSKAPTGQDMVLLDAFSSDAIPAHLLTKEAIGLYVSRLAPRGVVVLHISNRHLQLAHILARVASEYGLVAYFGGDPQSQSEPFEKRMRADARVVVLARDAADLGRIADQPNWRLIRPDVARAPWTDDFSNVLEAMRDARGPL